MSKTLGNVIDPLDTIKEFGTDALRFTLALGTAGQVGDPKYLLSCQFYKLAFLQERASQKSLSFCLWIVP